MIRMTALPFLTLALLAALAGCKEDKPQQQDQKPQEQSQAAPQTQTIQISLGEKPKTVTYYLEHRAELEELRARCKDNPGDMELMPHCITASKAYGASIAKDNKPISIY